MPCQGVSGYGHFNARFHEWTAATVFYSLLAPAATTTTTTMPLFYNCGGAADDTGDDTGDDDLIVETRDRARAGGDDGRDAWLCHLANSSRTLCATDGRFPWPARRLPPLCGGGPSATT